MEIIYSDGSRNILNIYKCNKECPITFLIVPAMGIRASYYHSFCHQLQHHYNVVSCDWRGQGYSSIRPSYQHDFGYKALVEDMYENVSKARSIFPSSKLIVLGHSLGGQVGSLFAARYADMLDGLIILASSLPYYKGWKGREKWRLWVGAHLLYPLCFFWGYYPGHIFGFAGREARTVMRDWSRHARTGNYTLLNDPFDYEEGLQKYAKPLLAIGMENDALARPQSIDNLLYKFKQANKTKNILSPDVYPTIDHFNWVKSPVIIIPIIQKWIHQNFE